MKAKPIGIKVVNSLPNPPMVMVDIFVNLAFVPVVDSVSDLFVDLFEVWITSISKQT